MFFSRFCVLCRPCIYRPTKKHEGLLDRLTGDPTSRHRRRLATRSLDACWRLRKSPDPNPLTNRLTTSLSIDTHPRFTFFWCAFPSMSMIDDASHATAGHFSNSFLFFKIGTVARILISRAATLTIQVGLSDPIESAGICHSLNKGQYVSENRIDGSAHC